MQNDLIKLCVDTYQNKVTNYSKEQAGEVIRKAFIDIIGTDKPDYRTFRKHKNEIFEIIEVALDQAIASGFTNGNAFFEKFVEYRDLNLGDTNEFYVEDKSILTVSKISGSHHDIRRQRIDAGQSFTVNTEWFGIKIYDHFLRLIAGRIDWVAFVNKVKEAIENKMAELVYASFMGSLSYLPAEFKCTGTFSRDAFLLTCDHVQASNPNSELTIVGTRSGLSKMVGTADAAWSEAMKDERNQLGFQRYYEGIRQMVLPQVHKANTFDFAYDANKALVLPTDVKPVKVVREGQAVIVESTDGAKNRDGSIEYEVQFKLGLATIFNVLYGYAALA